MPKRIPTPPPSDDEPKYLAVVQPYPLNANWELVDDYVTFARWIAGCIGPKPVIAVFYKPSARGMAILEVERHYPHFDRLLGEHRWKEFLKNPSDEEAPRVSRIFYSLYNSGREAQKDGWKRITVEDSWFRHWSLNNAIIRHPYPPTHWCPVPPEDKTNKSLCRPLPVKDKAPPPRVAPPVVGSERWVQQKTGPSQATPQALRGAWAKGNTLPLSPKVFAKGQKPTNHKGRHKDSSSRSAVSPSNAWNEPITGRSVAPSPASATGSPSNTASSSPQTPNFPPGLVPFRAVAPNSPSAYYPAPPGLVRTENNSGTGSGVGSGSRFGYNEPANIATSDPCNNLHEDFANILLSSSAGKTLYHPVNDDAQDPASAYVPPWELDLPDEPVYISGEADSGVQNYWEGHEDRPIVTPDPDLCTVHGVTCSKGICMSKGKKEVEARRKEEAEAEASRRKRRRRAGKGTGSSNSRARDSDDRATSHSGGSDS